MRTANGTLTAAIVALVLVSSSLPTLGQVLRTQDPPKLAAAHPPVNTTAVAPTSDETQSVVYAIVDLGAGLEPSDINNKGQIVGNTADGLPFLWEDDTLVLLPIPQNRPDEDDEGGVARAINDAGAIAGEAVFMYEEGEAVYLPHRAVVWNDGIRQQLPTLGDGLWDSSSAHSISTEGAVSGSSDRRGAEPDSTVLTAVVWRNGVPVDLNPADEQFCVANDVLDGDDDTPEVAVGHCIGDSGMNAIVWQSGARRNLVPCVDSCAANAVNKQGHVVGQADGRAFLWRDFDDVTYQQDSLALGINDQDDVVGYMWGAAGLSAFLWRGETRSDLNELIDRESGWSLTWATAINNLGQIVGFGDLEDEQHGFLLTPVPVVFIPGIAGSVLFDRLNPDELWPGLFDWDAHDKLSLFPNDNPSPGIVATDAVRWVASAELYGGFLGYLASLGYVEYRLDGRPERLTRAGCDLSQKEPTRPTLFVFPYDWRKDNAQSARALQEYIECVREFHPGAPVNLIAHSMGGLVARRYILDHPTDHHVNALITVGTPWLGAPKMIYVIETGKWMPFYVLMKHTCRHIVRSFTGAHQLLPGSAYYMLSLLDPMEEVGWDVDDDGAKNETYSYENYRQVMDSPRYATPPFAPGTAMEAFHIYRGAHGGQDDWRGDGTGVKYFHFAGVQPGAQTIGAVHMVGGFSRKRQSLGEWLLLPFKVVRPMLTMGDGTVPLESAAKRSALGDLNAPGACVVEVHALIAEAAEHFGMLKYQGVRTKIARILKEGNLPEDMCGSVMIAANAPAPLRHLMLVGAQSVVVSDARGNSLGLDSGDFVGQGYIPGVDTYDIGENAYLIVAPPSEAITLTLRTTEQPLGIDMTTRAGQAPTAAIRYSDVDIPSGAAVKIRFGPSGIAPVQYDANGDGEVDTILVPTVSVDGPAATDEEPPVVALHVDTASDTTIVTVSAQDAGSGVKAIYYSLDGQRYRQYSEPIRIGSPTVRAVYAFADDNLANRSAPVELQIEPVSLRATYLPVILR